MSSSKVRDMPPWLGVLVILLFNPIGLMGILPAVALLSFGGIAYTVTLVLVLRCVSDMWSSLSHLFQCVLPYFIRSPCKASLQHNSRVVGRGRSGVVEKYV